LLSAFTRRKALALAIEQKLTHAHQRRRTRVKANASDGPRGKRRFVTTKSCRPQPIGRDRRTDDGIAKRMPYTIEEPLIAMWQSIQSKCACRLINNGGHSRTLRPLPFDSLRIRHLDRLVGRDVAIRSHSTETIAVPLMPSTRAAPLDRSMHRPFTKGPRSFIRTVTVRPVDCDVTVT
jgi:hypothetical protein